MKRVDVNFDEKGEMKSEMANNEGEESEGEAMKGWRKYED